MDLDRWEVWSNSKCRSCSLGLLYSNCSAKAIGLAWKLVSSQGNIEATWSPIPRAGLQFCFCRKFCDKFLSLLLVSTALLCLCSECNQGNATCETDGACMVSISNMNGIKHHVRTCIPQAKLIPAGKPFFCLSSEDVRNTHCCYADFCNKIDLMVPSGKWGSAQVKEGLHYHLKNPDVFLVLYSHYHSSRISICFILQNQRFTTVAQYSPKSMMSSHAIPFFGGGGMWDGWIKHLTFSSDQRWC